MNDAHKKQSRAESLVKFKRQHILDSARRIFDAEGTSGLNMRAIAKEAGYSLGAAYSYFRTKEEIEVELLAGILGEVTRHIKATLPQQSGNTGTQAFSIFSTYFQERPETRKLFLVSIAGLGEKSGDIPASTRKELDSRLLSLMGLLANDLHKRTPATAAHAQEETTDFVTYLLGLMMLESGNCLKLLKQNNQEMVDRHGKRMLIRVTQQ